MTRLNFQDKQKQKQPITVLANWFNPNDPTKNGSTVFTLSSTVEVDSDTGVELHTLSLTTLVSTSYKATEDRKIQVRDLTTKKLIDATASKKIEDFVDKLVCEFVVSLDRTNDTFTIVEENYEDFSKNVLRDTKNQPVVVASLTYGADYKDIKIESYQDVFAVLVDLNDKAIYKNPTISLLLHLIAVGDSNYEAVFMEWYEEQFINPNDNYRALFGSVYADEYKALKAKEDQ